MVVALIIAMRQQLNNIGGNKMSQMIKDQRIMQEETTGVKLLEETMMDGSLVYNVTIFDDVIFYCTDLNHANELFDAIDSAIPNKIH